MKTIAVYSYTGGLGKSLATANLAVCLSRMGKNCALLDLDLDSPSLHFKFPSARYAPGTGGLSSYFLTGIKTLPEDSNKVSDIAPTATENGLGSLSKFASKLRLPQPYPHLKGEIHLIPTGNTFDEDYWFRVSGQLSKALLNIFSERQFQRLGDKAFIKVLKYLIDVKNEVANLNPKPDYFIVDLRSGLLQLAVTVANLWADVVACFFGSNAENTDYLSTFLPMLKRTENKKQVQRIISKLQKERNEEFAKAGFDLTTISSSLPAKELEIVPVLSRHPVGEEWGGPQIANVAKACGRDSTKDICVLHSDRDLEAHEEIYLGFQSDKPKNCRLSHEYLRLFRKLLRPEDILSDESEFAQNIGLPQHLNEFPRIFNLIRDTGALYNKDKNRNVSFKIETFQILLSGLKSEFDSKGGQGIESKKRDPKTDSKETGPEKFDGPEFEACLYNAGYSCGNSFGEDLKENWKEQEGSFDVDPYEAELELGTRLKEWCRFDSDVGFGRFKLKSLTQDDNRFVKCEILLIDSFLTPSKDTPLVKGDEFCSLMTGYVEGVLEKILDDTNVIVEHKLLDYHLETSRSKASLFIVTAKTKKQK